MEYYLSEVLLTAEQIQGRVAELGAQISRDYAGRDLLLIGILKGAVIFLSDLLRHITIPVQVDFMAVSSYGAATLSSGVVRILKDLDEVVEGREVLVVEDIIDTGLTLRYLRENLQARQPAGVRICTLLDKPDRRVVEVPVDYLGFRIPYRFVVGYGLDCKVHFRNLPYIAAVDQEKIRELF
ncbi:MAG: hypoxanthine phosphoribosyltransferase [Bacillota bacterium]|nr:hypoxanthine phosphoribosyltransferase [Bacillota bacterium]